MEKRQIIFRGKRKDNGQWVEGFLDYNPVATAFFIHVVEDIPPTYENPGGDVYSERFEVLPETIGQYSGYKDIKGNKIFDGDTVRICAGYSSTIAFKDGAFWSIYKHPEDGEEIPLFAMGLKEAEITGNIHQQ